MSVLNHGGPAFPSQTEMRDGSFTTEQGMTLRDWFAGKAMQGLLSNPKMASEILKHGMSWIESSSYAWADAMIAERAKETEVTAVPVAQPKEVSMATAAKKPAKTSATKASTKTVPKAAPVKKVPAKKPAK